MGSFRGGLIPPLSPWRMFGRRTVPRHRHPVRPRPKHCGSRAWRRWPRPPRSAARGSPELAELHRVFPTSAANAVLTGDMRSEKSKRPALTSLQDSDAGDREEGHGCAGHSLVLGPGQSHLRQGLTPRVTSVSRTFDCDRTSQSDVTREFAVQKGCSRPRPPPHHAFSPGLRCLV